MGDSSKEDIDMKILERIHHLIHNNLLRVDIAEHSLLRRGYRLLYYTLRGINIHRTMIDSAALTLYTLFALVPLLALVLLILGKFGVYDRVVEIIYDSAPQDWYAVLDTIVGAATTAAGNIAPGFFAVVGIATLLFAVFTLFRTAEESFNRVWGISKSRGFIVRYVAYIVVAIVVPVLALGAIILASDILSMLGLEHEMNRAISILLSLALATLACSLVYKFLPYTRVQWRMALIAGLFAGMGLSLWHWGYVYFQSMMTSYNVIYGGLAFIPLFILWLQVSWNILLTGCEVCCVLQHRSHFERIDRRRLKRREEDVLLKNERSVRVVIVGSGNVAEALARTLQSVAGVELVQIFARNRERAMEVASIAGCGWECEGENLAPADIYIISVSDRAVATVASSLHFPREAIVVHTAGSIPMSAIPAREGRRGILYALQSFTKGRLIRLDDVPLFIEADSAETKERLMSLAQAISSQVEYADSARRKRIHLAGVLVNNFVNHLYSLGAEVVEDEGLSFDVLKPLIMETAEKATDSDDPTLVQTGPAVRGDRVVTAEHLEMLSRDVAKQRIYKDLTESIWETSKKM